MQGEKGDRYQYGFMWYNKCTHKIKCSDEDPEVVLNSMKKYFLLSYLRGHPKNLLFYRIKRAKVITQDIVKSFALPSVSIDIFNLFKSEYICRFQNYRDTNGKLLMMVHDIFGFAIDHNRLVAGLKYSDYKYLKQKHLRIFGKEPNYFFFRKKKIRNKIIDKSKEEIIKLSRNLNRT